MPSVVLYTDSMEPITVLNVEMWALEALRRHRVLEFPVVPRLGLPDFTEIPKPSDVIRFHVVRVWSEDFVRKDKRHQFLFTNDDEYALLLKSEILPGQRKDWEDRRDGYAKGLLDGLYLALQNRNL